MDRHYVEKMGAELSLLGLGCMRFPVESGGDRNNRIDRKKAMAMADRLIQAGVNCFDTAYPYHNGDSEVWLSEAVVARYPRDSFYIADKLLMRIIETPEDMEKMFATQLERLKTDYIDFYLLHNVKVEEWKKLGGENIIKFLEDKLGRGQIRKKGFSFHQTPEELEFLLDQYDWDFVQLQFNFYDDKEQRAGEMYRMLEERGIPCIVMEPVRGGGLANLPESVTEVFKAERPDASMPEWCFRWAASHPNVAVVLSGMSNMEQVEENIKTFTDFEPVTKAELAVIEEGVKRIKALPTVPCTECRYCVEGCPMGIDIPAIFGQFNDYIRFARASYPRHYAEANGGSDENACISCGACVAVCPQHIQIPDELKRANDAAKKK